MQSHEELQLFSTEITFALEAVRKSQPITPCAAGHALRDVRYAQLFALVHRACCPELHSAQANADIPSPLLVVMILQQLTFLQHNVPCCSSKTHYLTSQLLYRYTGLMKKLQARAYGDTAGEPGSLSGIHRVVALLAEHVCARHDARHAPLAHLLSLAGYVTETDGEQAWLNMLPTKYRALPECPSAPPPMTAAAMAARDPCCVRGKIASTLQACAPDQCSHLPSSVQCAEHRCRSGHRTGRHLCEVAT